ncbi:MAG TPA: SHOCT domain-containing protein [Stenomitos sp.]
MDFTATGILLAGLLGTLAMTTWMYIAHAFGVERHNPGFFLGTLVFGVGRKAYAAGMVIHFLIGVIAAAIYAAIMSLLNIPGGVLWGMLFGIVHWFVLMLGYGLVASWHPAVKRGDVENPGFFGLNEGWTEPSMAFLDHLLFGAIVGGTLAYYRSMGVLSTFSASEWRQPSIAPTVAWPVMVVLFTILFIVASTLTAELGTTDEVFASALPEEEQADLIARLRERFAAGQITEDEYLERIKRLQG